jgi:hypothetical protein
MVTRLQLKKGLGEVAMMALDDLGGECFIPDYGMSLGAPKHIGEAFYGPEAEEWKMAVQEEMQSINEAGTLSEPVQLPAGAKAINLKFIFTKKVGEDGLVNRYKARLVYNHMGKGNEQEDNFAPVVNKTSLRVFLSAVAFNKWELTQADVKTAFLNADNPGLEYVRLPKLVVHSEEDRIRILIKALYGLQRAPKMWHKTFSTWAIEVGFFQSKFDQCLFIHSTKKQMMIIYVDDLLMTAESPVLMGEMCELLTSRFKSRVMGVPSYFLGMNIVYQKENGYVKLYQQTYIEAIVKKYGLETVMPKSLPMEPGKILMKSQTEVSQQFSQYGSLIGALLFLAVCSRPDISFAVGVLSKFVSNPTKEHWQSAVNLVSYLKGTKTKGIVLGTSLGDLVGYADSDWGSDVDDRMSVSGGIVFWGSSIITWHSRKQSMVSLSTAEAESHALVDVSKEVINVQRIVGEITSFFGLRQIAVPTIYTDNQPAIDSVLHGRGRTKHYDLRIKFLAQGIESGLFSIKKVASNDNIADMLTKALRNARFRMMVHALVLEHGQIPLT